LSVSSAELAGEGSRPHRLQRTKTRSRQAPGSARGAWPRNANAWDCRQPNVGFLSGRQRSRFTTGRRARPVREPSICPRSLRSGTWGAGRPARSWRPAALHSLVTEPNRNGDRTTAKCIGSNRWPKRAEIQPTPMRAEAMSTFRPARFARGECGFQARPCAAAAVAGAGTYM